MHEGSAAHGSVDASDTLQPHTDEMAVAGTLSLASGTGSSDSVSDQTFEKAVTVRCDCMHVFSRELLPVPQHAYKLCIASLPVIFIPYSNKCFSAIYRLRSRDSSLVLESLLLCLS